MLVSLLPAGAAAADTDIPEEKLDTEPADVPDDDIDPSPEESAEPESVETAEEFSGEQWSIENSFDAYVDRLLGEDAEILSTGTQIAGSRLTGDTRLAYDAVASRLPSIAQYGGSTYFPYNGSQITKDEANKLQYALQFDYPFEYYWHNLSWVRGSGYIKLVVSDEYRGEDEYTVDPAKAAAAYSTITNAAGHAARIISTARNLSTDIDRLVYFKEAICSLVDYNHPAADNDDTPYGNPWQMIWAFDNSSSTKIVCEGYAKAFQYLCDKTFTDGRVQCYSVNGVTSGNHRWNVVTFEGKNYLVDVTNCDGNEEGYSAGYPYRLFMVGASGSPQSGYTVHRPKVYTKVESNGKAWYFKENTSTYTYKENLVWGNAPFLSLSSTSYPIFYNITEKKLSKGVQYTWKPNASDNFRFEVAANSTGFRLPSGASLSPDGTLTYTPSSVTGAYDLTLRAAYSGYNGSQADYYVTVTLPEVVEAGPNDVICNPPTGLTSYYGSYLSGVTLKNPAGNTPGTWSWVNGQQTINRVGINKFPAVFTPEDPSLDPVTVEISVNVSPRSVYGASVTLSQTSYEYDGSAKCPKVTAAFGSTVLTEGVDYTVSYSDNVNKGTATVTIKGIGNYTGVKNAKFTIGGSTDCSITVTAPDTSDPSFAYVDVDRVSLDGLINNASESLAGKATINVRASGTVTALFVNLPVSSVKDMYRKSNADLEISMPMASITLPHKVFSTLSSKGQNLTVSFSKLSSTNYKVGITRDGEDFGSINLNAKVSMNLTNPSTGCTALYIDSNGSGHAIRKSVVKDGVLIIPVKGSTLLQIIDNSKDFSDTKGHWAEGAVDFVSSRDLFQGTGGNVFSPDMTMSRAMMVTVLHRLEDQPLEGKSSFSDVPSNSWFYNSIAWAAGKGIIENSTGNYYPDGAAPREEMALLFYRYARAMGNCDISVSAPLSGFTDASQISSDDARQAMSWAVGVGLMKGMSETTLGPNLSATRAQVATIFQRFCNLIMS